MKKEIENGVEFELDQITPKKERTLADIKQERIEVLEEKVKHYQTMEMLHQQLIESLKESNLNLSNELKNYKK
jgi:hypothetical protein